jgi:predicted RNA-binding Zn ribbon-like protein
MILTCQTPFIGYNGRMEKSIRRGGLRTPEGILFELTGGNLALDFVNTVDSRPTDHPNELLPTYNELFSWARQTKVRSRMEELNLIKKADRHPNEAEAARKTAVALRELLFQMFNNVIDGKKISEDTLSKWNKYVQRSNSSYQLVRTKDGFSWEYNADPLEFDAILWPIVHSAVELMIGPNLTKLRKCAADNCDWLFLDMSKAGSRLWCDMTICGNRAKANRYYLKKKNSPLKYKENQKKRPIAK